MVTRKHLDEPSKVIDMKRAAWPQEGARARRRRVQAEREARWRAHLAAADRRAVLLTLLVYAGIITVVVACVWLVALLW